MEDILIIGFEMKACESWHKILADEIDNLLVRAMHGVPVAYVLFPSSNTIDSGQFRKTCN